MSSRVLRLVSFGYLHLAAGEEPPIADHVVDVRDRLADPAGYRQVLALLESEPLVDGRDARIRAIVLSRPGADAVLAELTWTSGVIAVGCGQGHDRSVALVELLGVRVGSAGRAVVVEHRHVDLPRVR